MNGGWTAPGTARRGAPHGGAEGPRRARASSLCWLVGWLAAFGCSGAPAPGLDAAADVGGADAGDAGGEGGDAGRADADAGGPDEDGDGVPAALDCDDADGAVGSTATSTCTNECALSGTVTCADGVWGECSAPLSCLCATEGERRIGACGRCGTVSQECRSGRWFDLSLCAGEGVCDPTSFEDRTYRCARQQRFCDDTCSWTEWLDVDRAPGECEPGERTCVFVDMYRVCTDECVWMSVSREECRT